MISRIRSAVCLPLGLLVTPLLVTTAATAQTQSSLPPAPIPEPPSPGVLYSPGSPGSQSVAPTQPSPALPSPTLLPQPSTEPIPSRSGSVSQPTTTPLGTPLSGTSSSTGDRLSDNPYPNGYTWVGPSTYVTPPVITPAPYYGVPAGGTVIYEPNFLHTTVVPYDPVWPYAYMGLPGTYYRERVSYGPYGARYRMRTYTPRARDFR